MSAWESHRGRLARRRALERDDGRCLLCGNLATDVHHRIPRSLAPARKFDLPNLVSLCRWDHLWVENTPEESRPRGFLLHSWDDPAAIPVRSIFGVLMLTPYGTTQQITEGAQP